jgi:hypothetical protein
MVLEFFRALLLAALPDLASCFIFGWVLRRRQLGTVTSLKQVEQAIKRQSGARATEEALKRAGSRARWRGAHLSRATGWISSTTSGWPSAADFTGGRPADVRRR